eukprot:1953106-Rhodomonas_salina.2
MSHRHHHRSSIEDDDHVDDSHHRQRKAFEVGQYHSWAFACRVSLSRFERHFDECVCVCV